MAQTRLSGDGSCSKAWDLGEAHECAYSKMRDASRLLRRRQFSVSDKERKFALLGTMIRDFGDMIANLDGEIAAEEDRTRIKDTGHPHIRQSPGRRPSGARIYPFQWRTWNPCLMQPNANSAESRCSCGISNRSRTINRHLHLLARRLNPLPPRGSVKLGHQTSAGGAKHAYQHRYLSVDRL